MKRVVAILTIVLAFGAGAIAKPTPASAGRIVKTTCTFYVNGTPVASAVATGDSAQFINAARQCSLFAASGTGVAPALSVQSTSLVNGKRYVVLKDHHFDPVTGGLVIRTTHSSAPAS